MNANNHKMDKWIEVLQRRDGQAKEAAYKLGEIGDVRAVKPLIDYVLIMRDLLEELNSLTQKIPHWTLSQKELISKYGLNKTAWHGYGEPELMIEEAERALVNIGDISGIKTVLEGNNPNTIIPAIRVLCGLDGKAGNAIKNESEDIQIGKNIPYELVSSLVTVLGKEDLTWNIARGWAALALGGINDDFQVIQKLRDLLNNDYSVRLGIFIPLLGTPSYGDYKLGEIAGLSLVRLKDKQSSSQIIKLALTEWWRIFDFHNPKQQFIKYMFHNGFDTVIPEMISISNQLIMQGGNEEDYGKKVVSCLATIGGESASKALIGYLNSENKHVLKDAIKALGEVGDLSAIDALSRLDREERSGKKAIKEIEKRFDV
jgi:hypothetical protein